MPLILCFMRMSGNHADSAPFYYCQRSTYNHAGNYEILNKIRTLMLKENLLFEHFCKCIITKCFNKNNKNKHIVLVSSLH